MGDGEESDRSRKHSQDKILRAFLEHSTGAHPAGKPRPVSVPPSGDEAARPDPAGEGVAAGAVVRGRLPSNPPPARRRSVPYSVAQRDGSAARGRREPSAPRVAGPTPVPDMDRVPTEIRPSPHAGVVPARPAGAPAPRAPVAPSAPVAVRDAVREGSIVGGKYRLTRLLGRGGVGEVYEAVHDVIGLKVAVKLIRFEYAGNAELSARFLQEARAAAAVGHPGIVQVHDVGTSPDGRTYLVMEYLDGEDLEKVLARRQRVDVAEIVPLLIDALDALGAAHAKGILHRDMKPENVFLVPGRRGDRVVKLLDFGIARLADETESAMRLTRPGAVMGTPYYMSPEQARGEAKIDAGVDLYAVGVMLYEALVGQLPFTGNSYNEVLSKVQAQPFPRVRVQRPEVPEELERIIFKACARERADRFHDAAEFADALLPFRPAIPTGRSDSAGGGVAAVRTPSAQTPLPTTARPTAPGEQAAAPAAAPSGGPGELPGSASAESAPALAAEPVAGRPRSTPPPRRRSIVAAIAIGLSLAALVAGGLIFGLGGGTVHGRDSAGAAVSAPAVRLRVVGAPAGAVVRFDGRTVGDDFRVPQDTAGHILEVLVPGRPPIVRTIHPLADATVDLAAGPAGSVGAP